VLSSDRSFLGESARGTGKGFVDFDEGCENSNRETV